MSIVDSYTTNLEIQFNPDTLDRIRKEVLGFHYANLESIRLQYDAGNTKHSPAIGYYIPLYESTHRDRDVSSWVGFESSSNSAYTLDKIKMKVTDAGEYQNIHVMSPNSPLDIYDDMEELYSSITVPFQKQSASISIQEFGYSMKFHKDAGVHSRIHIPLNRNSIDYFYTSPDTTVKMEYGECYVYNASSSVHGFMSFQDEPRVHIILDVEKC